MVVWLGGVVFCWWVLFIRKFILDKPSQISEEPTSGTGVLTAGSVAGETGAGVGEAWVGHCFGM